MLAKMCSAYEWIKTFPFTEQPNLYKLTFNQALKIKYLYKNVDIAITE